MTPFAHAVHVLTAGLALTLAAGPIVTRASDVLAWFTVAKRAAIESGRAAVELLPKDNVHLAVMGAARTTVDADRLVGWYREIDLLQRGSYIPIIQRFSDPPNRADVDALVLDDDEVEALRKCRPGDCDVKLAAEEMHQVRAAMAVAGAGWREAGREAFRQVVLTRAREYRLYGFAGAPPYHDRRDRVVQADEFNALVDGCRVPGLDPSVVMDYLRTDPMAREGRFESFLIWSRDMLGDAKPIVGITEVSILRGFTADDPTLVVSTQVFATHYIDASSSVTAIVNGSGGARLLVYVRCVRTDVFRGPFGGIVRRMVSKRVRQEGPVLLEGLRRTLESGPPPARVPR